MLKVEIFVMVLHAMSRSSEVFVPVAHFSTSTWFPVEGRVPCAARRRMRFEFGLVLYIIGFFMAKFNSGRHSY